MLTNFTLVMYKIAEKYNVPCNTYINFLYLYLSYLLTRLIYARTQSPQKIVFFFSHTGHGTWPMIVSVTKTLMMGVKLMTRVQKNTHLKSKGHCKDECLKKNSYIFLHNNDRKTPYYSTETFILTYCGLTSIYCPYFSIMLTIRSVILKSTLH